MIDISKFIRDKTSVSFLSFIIGLGVIVLAFHKPYPTYQSLSVPITKIEGKTIRVGGKCYSYSASDSLCPLVNKDGRRSN